MTKRRIAHPCRRSLGTRAALMALLASSVSVGLVVTTQAPAAANRAFSVRFSENIEGGQIRVAGNSWLTCSTTQGVAAGTCAAAREYGTSGRENSNNPAAGSRTMIPNDVDGVTSTTHSAASELAIPDGAVVRWAGLYATNANPVGGALLLDTPASPDIEYVSVTPSQIDQSGAVRGTFADVTELVRDGGGGLYTVAPATFTPRTASGWVLMVVYGETGGTNRQVVINDGLIPRAPGGRTNITFGGFQTPPSGNVRADVATVIYDPDAGFTDFVSLGDTAATQTRLPNPGPLPDDYSNASVRNFGTKPPGAPNDANNFSVDAKVTQTLNLVGNNRTSAVAGFDTIGSAEFELPAVIGIAIDNFAAGATLDKDFVDENGGDVEPGDFLTYNLSVRSTGSEAIQLATLSDDLPDGVTYVPGSLVLGAGNYTPGPATDASGDDVGEYDDSSRTVRVRLGQGANATNGGSLPPRPDSPEQTATFRVQVDTDVDTAAISNVVRLTGTGSETGSPVTITSPPSSFTPSLDPDISLVKTATLDDGNGNGTADVGESVTYGFTVTNSGNTRLVDVGVEDPTLPGPVNCAPTTLEPGDDAVCTAGSRPVTRADFDAGVLTNTATASGTDPTGAIVTDTAGTSTPVTAGAPELELTKVADFTAPEHDTNGNGEVDAGETIGYSFVVRNTGTVSATDLQIDDDLVGAVTCPPGPLAPNAQVTCAADADYEIGLDDVDNGSVVNTATASGANPRGGPRVESNPSSTETPSDPAPAISLAKTATVDPAANQDAAEAGDTITYSFVATNTGNVTLSDVGVTDATLSGAITCTPTTLAPGDSATCTGADDRIVTQGDIDAGDPLENTAVASGTPPPGAGGQVTGSDTEIVFVADPVTSLSITKSAVPSSAPDDPGSEDTIAYSFLVTNTGNITVDDIEVLDPLLADAGIDIVCTPTSLGPNDDADCTAQAPYVITTDDVDAAVVDNAASATGSPVQGDDMVVSPPAETSTPVVAEPEIELVKTATLADSNGNGTADAGEVITYGFEVTNTGDTTLNDVTVSDPDLTGAITCAPTQLGPGAAAACMTSTTRTVTDDDIAAGGPLVNTATATGTPPAATGLDPVTDQASASTDLSPADPSLTVDKEAGQVEDSDGSGDASPGDRIRYTFTVTNTGNVALSEVRIDDPMLAGADPAVPVSCDAQDLSPGDVTQCEATYPITQEDVDRESVDNTATAVGDFANQAVESEADNTSTALPPDVDMSAALELVKTAALDDADGDGVADVGERIRYRFRVTNTGAERIWGLRIEDPMLSDAGIAIRCARRTLDPGQSTTCRSVGKYRVTAADVSVGEVENTAQASARTPSGGQAEVLSPEDSVSVVSNADAVGGDGGSDDQSPSLAETGGPSPGLGLLGGLLTVTGALLLLARRRMLGRD